MSKPLRHLTVVIALAALPLLLHSCGGKKEFIAEKDLSPEEKLEEVSANFREWVHEESRDSASIQGYYLQAYKGLFRVYDTTSFQPVWCNEKLQLTERTLTFMKLLSKSAWYGLDSGLYYINDIHLLLDSANKDHNFVSKAKKLALCDVLLTNAYLLINVHLEKGYIDSASGMQVWKIDSLYRDPVKELLASTEKNITSQMLSRQPNNIEYRYLLNSLQHYLDSAFIDERSFSVPFMKPDSVACRDSIKAALIHWKLLDESVASSDSAQIASLKKFQELVGMDADGIPGANTIACLRMSSYERFLQACLAIEKWKWKDKRDPTIMLHVNIPAYTLHVVRNDSLVREHRVVTGLPDKQTPEFKAKLKWVTMFPYWNVPHSIASEEIAPHLRRGDTAYLNKHGYEMFCTNKEPIDPALVPWRRLTKDYFPYRLRQKGGPLNSLGLIQFHFPNKYDVYLHDTPAKYFFKKSTRSFSHGCIRLQDPFAFGEFIIRQDLRSKRERDTFNIDTLYSWVNKKIESRFYLRKSVPIEIDYISVTGNESGKITFHFDIYGRDKKYIKYMAPGKPPRRKENPANGKKKKEDVVASDEEWFKKYGRKTAFLFPGELIRVALHDFPLM